MTRRATPPRLTLATFPRAMRPRALLMAVVAGVLLAGCGGGAQLLGNHAVSTETIELKTPNAGQKLGFPTVATKNTTRVAGADAAADAAGVALAVFPSAAPGTHPGAVTVAPLDDWQAAIASSVLMARPIRAPVLLSGPGSLPAATSDALGVLTPTGAGQAGGAQVIRIGNVPTPGGMRAASIQGSDPYALAAGIDRFMSAAQGRASNSVVIASGENPAFAMPAAGWAAESGDPVLFVTASSIPKATRQALLSHQKPRIYVLGPSSVIGNRVLSQLRRYGPVKRVGGSDPPSNSVAFAEYRDPPCQFGQPCAELPGSFGWAMRSPGHGYVLINSHRPLDAAAAAALSGSGDYGPQLLTADASTLPRSVLNFFLNFATPGFTQEGPTAAVYNHGWVIGDQNAISLPLQAQLDNLLEVVPQSSK
jgi:hypothetical protein